MACKGIQINLAFLSWDVVNQKGKTGDSANITLRWIKDGIEQSLTGSPMISEVDSTNCPGMYKVTVSGSDTNCDCGVLCGKSSTSTAIQIRPVIVFFDNPRVPPLQAVAASSSSYAGIYQHDGTFVNGYPQYSNGTYSLNYSGSYWQISSMYNSSFSGVKGLCASYGTTPAVTISPYVVVPTVPPPEPLQANLTSGTFSSTYIGIYQHDGTFTNGQPTYKLGSTTLTYSGSYWQINSMYNSTILGVAGLCGTYTISGGPTFTISPYVVVPTVPPAEPVQANYVSGTTSATYIGIYQHDGTFTNGQPTYKLGSTTLTYSGSYWQINSTYNSSILGIAGLCGTYTISGGPTFTISPYVAVPTVPPAEPLQVTLVSGSGAPTGIYQHDGTFTNGYPKYVSGSNYITYSTSAAAWQINGIYSSSVSGVAGLSANYINSSIWTVSVAPYEGVSGASITPDSLGRVPVVQRITAYATGGTPSASDTGIYAPTGTVANGYFTYANQSGATLSFNGSNWVTSTGYTSTVAGANGLYAQYQNGANYLTFSGDLTTADLSAATSAQASIQAVTNQLATMLEVIP